MAVEKLLPQNVEAEAGVLGSLLISPDALVEVRATLQPEDFYREAHRVIYQAILDLAAEGDIADLISLTDELARRGKLDEVGGAAYVSSLANQVPTHLNIGQYARIVERTSTLRRLITTAGQIAAVAYHEPDAEAALEESYKLLDAVRSRRRHHALVWFDQAVDAFLDECFQVYERGGQVGVKTGDRHIDSHIHGFMPGELVYLAGRPGSGKSTVGVSWATSIAEECQRRGGPGMVAYITLEMRATQQVKRIVSAFTSVDGRVIRAGFQRIGGGRNEEDYEAVKRGAQEMKRRLRRRIGYFDKPLRMREIRSHLERLVDEHNCVCAFVDYLGLVDPEDAKADTYKRVSDMSRQLKQMALDLNIPIVCLVQLNRETEKRANKRPMLADLRDSGNLEQDADFVFGIYNAGYYFPNYARVDAETGGHFGNFVELGVLKAREGVANIPLPLYFEGEYTRVTEWPETVPWLPFARLKMTEDIELPEEVM